MIDTLLRRYPSNCQPSQVEPLGSAGGMSGARFWRITAPRGTLMLRRWPTEHPSPDRLRFIHTVLAHAAQRGIKFLPLPITTLDGQSFVEYAGHLWELAPWLPGTADYERLPSIERLRAAMTALAQFHIATADFDTSMKIAATQRVAGAAPAVSRHLIRLHELMRGGINQLSRAIADPAWPQLAPLARQFVAALPHAVPGAIAQLEPLANVPLPLQPCIRDIWHDHVLLTGNEVTGLIDFGAVDIDTPATDVARLLGSLVSEDASGWQTGLAAYSTVRPLSQQESLAVFALDTSGTILAGCNWIRWIYIEGRCFENPEKIVLRFTILLQRLRLDSDQFH